VICYTAAMAQVARIARRGTLTWRDLRHTPDDGNRYEIINGEVYVSPAPYVTHQETLGNLYTILRAHVARRHLGTVFFAPIGVVLEKASAVQPDLIFIAAGRRSIIEDKAVFGAPDLIVEVQSPSTASRDRGMKRDLYARIGVPHYWMIDPRKHTLLALRLEAGSYGIEAEVGARGTFKPALFPGLTVRARDVFAR
jgi:Uma2 family endonuclease